MIPVASFRGKSADLSQRFEQGRFTASVLADEEGDGGSKLDVYSLAERLNVKRVVSMDHALGQAHYPTQIGGTGSGDSHLVSI